MRRRLNSRAYDPYDEWLDSLGLYRKQVARDGSCLFRAVAEQVFLTQTEHVQVRSLCLQYMELHKEDFQPFLDMPLDHYVYNLHDMREWGGHLEIMAMSRLFKRNFIIYQEIGQEPYKATDIEGKALMLSFTHGNHYDIVYKKEDASSRGFCQSVIYDILYSHVFKLKDVRLAVDTMLHDKEYANLRRDSSNSAELKEIGALVEKILGTSISRDSQDGDEKNEERASVDDIHPDDVRGLLAHGIPPFPYKVAKSLDPDIYRNIEFDTWNTVRREARYGPFDCNGFQAGVKVLIKLDLLPNRSEVEDMRPGNVENGETKTEEKSDVYHGHIQEMSENKGPVDVYIEEIGRRLKVPYESLEKVPPTPPRSPWHGQVQPHIQASGGVPAVGGGGMPGYKNLSGYYQKAPLPPENEFVVSKNKKKGAKQMRDSMPSSGRHCGPSHNSGMRGRSLGSPAGVSHSPRSRTPQGMYSQTNYYRNSHNRGIGRAREDFPSFSSSSSLPSGVEGVWAFRPNGNQHMVSSTPKSSSAMYYPSTPQPPMCEDETKLQIRAVTEALQQVMSAGGQEVRITGQRLEVVNSPGNEFVDDEACLQVEGNSCLDCTLTSTQADIQVSDVVTYSSEVCSVVQTNHTPLNISEAEPIVSQPTEELITQSPLPQTDPNIIYLSPSATQIGSPSSQNSAMYTVTFPSPYSSPAYIQMLPPGDGNLTPCEFTPSSTAGQARPESADGVTQGSDMESMKMNPGMTSVMIYQVPVMYSGYGYGYNQPYTYVPVMPSPNSEEGKSPPSPGTEMYQPVVSPCGWVPGYMGEMMPPPPMPPYPLPPPNIPPYHREPPVPQYPPPPHFNDRPPYHHHRGRGRGGSHYQSHQNRGHYYNEPPYEGMSRGGGGGCQRPLPPRFHKGGGPPSGRGGPRYPPPHVNNTPPPAFQRNLQYEGQPLMQMGSRKSSSESLASQAVTGSNMSSGGIASPPLSYTEPDRPPGVIPISAQNVPPLPPPLESMAYYSNPQGYVMSGPWMWKMM